MWSVPATIPKAATLEAVRVYARIVAGRQGAPEGAWDDDPPPPPDVLVEARMVNLRGSSLAEYAGTDAQWHMELVAALAVFDEEMGHEQDRVRRIREWQDEVTGKRAG
jgi:hypothetical protein